MGQCSTLKFETFLPGNGAGSTGGSSVDSVNEDSEYFVQQVIEMYELLSNLDCLKNLDDAEEILDHINESSPLIDLNPNIAYVFNSWIATPPEANLSEIDVALLFENAATSALLLSITNAFSDNDLVEQLAINEALQNFDCDKIEVPTVTYGGVEEDVDVVIEDLMDNYDISEEVAECVVGNS